MWPPAAAQDSERSGKTLTLLFFGLWAGLLGVHLFPQMRNAVKIKTIISPTVDAVKSQLHTTEVFRFITHPEYAYELWIRIG